MLRKVHLDAGLQAKVAAPLLGLLRRCPTIAIAIAIQLCKQALGLLFVCQLLLCLGPPHEGQAEQAFVCTLLLISFVTCTLWRTHCTISVRVDGMPWFMSAMS